MNSKRLLCFLLGAALLLQTPATAYAEETLTYEQYKGGSGYSSTTQEQDYAIVEISTEEDLRRLAENCVLDSWSRGIKVVLRNDIVLSMESEFSIPKRNCTLTISVRSPRVGSSSARKERRQAWSSSCHSIR